ncbi:MAG: hypothetical protein HWN69_07075 [Desulfobacterales bacterium]|nr:hypothetical protein [Desulfobacterales bacterium]
MVESINLSIDYVPVKKYNDLEKRFKAQYQRIKELEAEKEAITKRAEAAEEDWQATEERIKELKETKIVSRSSFRLRFGRGFECKCRVCGNEAIIIFKSHPGRNIGDLIIKCPKCKNNKLII